jgi:hypothetical protein
MYRMWWSRAGMRVNKILIAGIIFFLGAMSWAHGDIYINVMAVNGADAPKNSTVKFDLPGELTVDDILDTNGLQLDYSVDDAAYYVHGDVTLKPKESKTFRIHIKDRWQVTPDQTADLKKQIDKGYETLGRVHDAQKADILKTRLSTKLDYIVNLQNANADSVQKRIDAYRIYTKEIKRIQNDALSVDYWRSDPGVEEKRKIIRLNIEVENPTKAVKHFKHKNYLPQEVSPEDVVEDEGFEVRFDTEKQLSFLFKEEDLNPAEKKKYAVGILDIWSVSQRSIDYLRSRASGAYAFLKDTRFADSAKFLTDRISGYLNAIEASQSQQRPILEHISAYRDNKKNYDYAQKDVETLEKLLAVSKEDLEKSKVENILQRMQSLRSIADVSKVMSSKKFTSSTAWAFIGWVLLFVGLLTIVNFVIWALRSKDKKIKDEPPEQKSLKS